MDERPCARTQAPTRIALVLALLALAAFSLFGLQASTADAADADVTTATFGKTSVGEITDNGMFANYKIVNSATLSVPASVSKLSVYAIPGINSPSPQALRAVIYSDSEESPSALVATGAEVTYQGSVNGSGWFDLPFASPVALDPGTYWIGFITGEASEGLGYRYDEVANSRAWNVNSFAAGPSNPFGAANKDSEQASIYASYLPRVSESGEEQNEEDEQGEDGGRHHGHHGHHGHRHHRQHRGGNGPGARGN